jgi:hypothetical protein
MKKFNKFVTYMTSVSFLILGLILIFGESREIELMDFVTYIIIKAVGFFSIWSAWMIYKENKLTWLDREKL